MKPVSLTEKSFVAVSIVIFLEKISQRLGAHLGTGVAMLCLCSGGMKLTLKEQFGTQLLNSASGSWNVAEANALGECVGEHIAFLLPPCL